MPGQSESDTSALHEEGWTYFLRLQEPTATAKDLDSFEEWKGRSRDHLQVAQEIEELWIEMDSVRDLPWPTATELEQDREGTVPAFLRRRWVAVGSALAASLAALVVGYLFLSSDTSSYSTGRGEHRMVNLPDGSEVIMGAMSEVTVAYSPVRRHLRQMKGEVLFTVAEDPRRPFVVDTPSASVQAVGTSFNINAATNVTVVSVVKGIVRVDLDSDSFAAATPVVANASRELTANQQISFGNGAILQDVHPASIDDVLAWRSGRFVFSGTPLARVIEEINRYSDNQIRLGDPEAGELLFTGAIQRTQFDSWLSALEASFPVRITKEGTSSVVYSLSPSP